VEFYLTSDPIGQFFSKRHSTEQASYVTFCNKCGQHHDPTKNHPRPVMVNCPKCTEYYDGNICYVCGYLREDWHVKNIPAPTRILKVIDERTKLRPPKPPPKKKRPKSYIHKPKRETIFKRDGNKCLRCGSENNLTIDHIKPVSKGGKNDNRNLQTLCYDCNQAKATKSNDYTVNFVANSRIRKMNHEIIEQRKTVTAIVIYRGEPHPEDWWPEDQLVRPDEKRNR